MKSALEGRNNERVRMRACSFDGDASSSGSQRSLKFENHVKRIDRSTQTERGSRKFKWSGKILRTFRKRKTSSEVGRCSVCLFISVFNCSYIFTTSQFRFVSCPTF